MINKLRWDEVIFFFDVDDTLINTFTNSLIASDSIRIILSKELGEEKGLAITKEFKKIFNTLAQGHWGSGDNREHDEIIRRIEELQKPVIDKYGSIRKWSREVFLKIAGERLGVELQTSLIYKVIDKYWEEVSKLSIPKQGVLGLFEEIKKHQRPIYFVTGSDARLKINNEGLFVYNPVESENYKKRRMELLKNNGLFFNDVSIGDPEDKPHLDFFQKAINIAEKDLKTKIDNSNLVMFGDSYEADLKTPKEKLNFGLVVLYRENQKEIIEEEEKYISTGNLLSVVNIFE